jgi:hypothetical protein
MYECITKLCRQQAKIIQDHDNENVRNIGKGEAKKFGLTCSLLASRSLKYCKNWSKNRTLWGSMSWVSFMIVISDFVSSFTSICYFPLFAAF